MDGCDCHTREWGVFQRTHCEPMVVGECDGYVRSKAGACIKIVAMGVSLSYFGNNIYYFLFRSEK